MDFLRTFYAGFRRAVIKSEWLDRQAPEERDGMNEILAVVAFLVLVGLLASRMERDHREHKIHDDSRTEVELKKLPGAITPIMPRTSAPRN